MTLTVHIPNTSPQRVREIRKQLAAIAARMGYCKCSRIGNPIPTVGSIGLLLLAIAEEEVKLSLGGTNEQH